ncbi:MAG: hypothetical protein WC717_02380 [Candidatus Micrarchaeia archaeon]|jgi:hypothetical protein
MEFLDEVVRVKKPPARLIDALAEQYSTIAFKFGYLEAQSPCWLYFMRKGGDAAAFEVQFGNISEFKSSLGRLVKSGAGICFLVTSSRAHTMRLEEARGLLLRNFEIKKQKYVLMDIETGRHLLVNFEWDRFEQRLSSRPGGNGEAGQEGEGRPIFREQRRKKIYGRRGEHKEQD